ncbi:peptidase, partial [Streptomyces sp. TRM76130]|nr:peptidase [Streptomyces sp. TRM76130]
ADAEQVRGGWQQLYEANRSEVGKDPDLILPGQRLTLTGKASQGESERSSGSESSESKAERKAESKSERKTASEESKKKSSTPSLVAPVDASTGTPYHQTGSSWSQGYHTGVD